MSIADISQFESLLSSQDDSDLFLFGGSVGTHSDTINIPLSTLVHFAKNGITLPSNLQSILGRTTFTDKKAVYSNLIDFMKNSPGESVSPGEFKHLLKTWDSTPVPVRNIKINVDDLVSGNYNTEFYGKTLPTIVDYISSSYQEEDKDLSPDNIYEKLDDSTLSADSAPAQLSDIPSVLRKLPDLISQDGLGDLLDKDETGGRKRMQKLFSKNDPSSENRETARKTAERLVSPFIRLGFGSEFCDNVTRSFDIIGRLCDSLDIDATKLFRTLKMVPYNRTVSLFDPTTKTIHLSVGLSGNDLTATLCHELIHAITDSPDIMKVIDKKPLFSFLQVKPDTRTGTPVKHDLVRALMSRDWYASKRYDSGFEDANPSEYYSKLVSDFLHGNKIPRTWIWDVSRKLKKVKGKVL